MIDEMVYIVDEEDNVVGSVPRSRMRAENLRHRVVRIFLFNSKGEMFVHQRTFEKDIYPGYFDVTIAGTVTSGDYEENAVRELEEEVGIKDQKLEFLFKHKLEDTFTLAYRCVYDGPLRLQKEEIIDGKFIPIDEVKELMDKEKFHPDGVAVFKKYLGIA